MAERDDTMPLVHLYRGELGRMTTYRVRLDTTTNWAVGTSAAVISFVLGKPEAPPFVLGLAVFFTFAFAHLEARRYQRFFLIRERVRMLECGLYGEILGAAPKDDWKAELRDHLLAAQASLPWWRAMGNRLRRNYGFILFALACAWALEVSLADRPFAEAGAVGPIDGLQVLYGLAGVAAVLCIWAFAAGPSDSD